MIYLLRALFAGLVISTLLMIPIGVISLITAFFVESLLLTRSTDGLFKVMVWIWVGLTGFASYKYIQIDKSKKKHETEAQQMDHRHEALHSFEQKSNRLRSARNDIESNYRLNNEDRRIALKFLVESEEQDQNDLRRELKVIGLSENEIQDYFHS